MKSPPNEARNPPGGLSVEERIPAKGAGVKEAVGGPVCIAIHFVQPDGVPATREPHYTHEPRAQNWWDQGDTASTHNDGEEAVAVLVGLGQEDLTASLADDPKDGTPFPDPGLLNQSDIPAKGRQVGPTLSKAGEVGRDDARPRVSGLANAIMALAISAKGAGVPRRDPWYAAVAPKGSDTARQGPMQHAPTDIP